MKKLLRDTIEYIDNKSREIMVCGSLFMMASLVWTLAILCVPKATGEASFFLEDIDDELPLGLFDNDDEIILCPYQDLANHWAKDNCMIVIEKEIMNPKTEELFYPNNYVSRGEFVTTLGRLENIDKTNRKVKKFRDVNSSMFYAPYVAWAEENGILANERNNKFRPDELITREEMATMLRAYLENIRGAILTGGTGFYDDNAISNFAVESVSLVTGSGYLGGRSDGNFDPKAGTTRAELATLIVRLIEEFDL